MKKILSMVLVLTMLMSLNIFALSSTNIVYNEVTVVGEGAGIETVLTKSGTTLTASVYLVGPMVNISGIQPYFKILDTSKLTFESVTVADEFLSIVPNVWTDSAKEEAVYAGYQYGNASSSAEYISVDSGERIKYIEIKYTIADSIDVNSNNYSEMLSYNNSFKGWTSIVFNDNAFETKYGSYPEVFSFDASGLDSYNLSINTPANGVAELGSTTVAGGQSTTLTVIPAVGYYIDSVMVGETNITSSFINVYHGGSINYTPTASTDITVTFAEIVVDEDVTTASGMTGVDALTLPEVFRGKATNEATEDSSIAFGQIAPNAGKTVKGYGIYLTNSDGSDVTTAAPSIGPKFAAKSISGDNQFGIIFEQIKPGSYFAQTYIEYEDESIVFGIKVPFTVAE